MDINGILADPDFHALPPEERRKVMVQIDPDFASLPTQEQHKVVFAMSNGATIQQEQPPKEKSSLLRRAVGDTAISALKGAIGLPESVVGLADIATGGRVGKALETVGYRPKEAKQILDTMYSPEQQEANAAVQQAQGFVPTLKAAVENPSTIFHSAVESAPSMIGAGGIARGGMKILPKISPVVAGALGEGAMSAGSTAEQVRQDSPDGNLTPAQSAISLGSGALTSGLGIVGGKVAQRLGITDIDSFLASGAPIESKKAVTRAIIEGAISEGVLEEMPQSAQEQAAQNLATGRPIGEGVGNATAMGGITGGVMGGGGNVIANTSPAPAGPLSRAVGMADTRAVAPVQPIGQLVAERRGMNAQPQPVTMSAPVEQPVAQSEPVAVEHPTVDVEQPAPVSRAAAPASSLSSLISQARNRVPTLPANSGIEGVTNEGQRNDEGQGYDEAQSYADEGQDAKAGLPPRGDGEDAQDERGVAANLPESQQNTDAQIPPVAGLSEPVDTQVSPEKGGEGVISPETPTYRIVRINGAAEQVPQEALDHRKAAAQLRDKSSKDLTIEQESALYRELEAKATALKDMGWTADQIGANAENMTVPRWKEQVDYGYLTGKFGLPPDSPSPPSPKVEAPAPVGEEAVEVAAPAVDPTTATRNVLQQLAAPKRKSDTLVSTLKDAHGKEILNQLVKQEMVRFPGQGRAEITKAGQEWLVKNPAPEQPKKPRAKRQTATAEQASPPLFSTNDTPSRADLTLERVRSSFPTLPVTEDNGTFTVTTPSGIPIRISKVGEIEFGPEQRAAAEKEYGRKLRDDERPAAEFKPLDHGAIINLTERGIGELDHESFHAAMSLALTEKQKAAVLRTFGNEEKAAAEYQRLKESGALEGKRGNYWLSKIYRFLRALRQLISPTAKGVMEDVASGKVWGKAHAGDGGARYAAAWHGSPHDHNKFDSSKIGSGEGAQAYGHGLYFAGSKDVAEWYREKLTANQGRLLDANGDEIDAERDLTPEENFAAIILQNNGGDYAKAEADIRKWSSAEDAKEQVAMLDSLKAKGVRVEVNKGRLYEVELAPSEDEYLLWDKPLSEQSEKVQAALGDRIYEKEYFIDGTPLHEVALAPIVRAKLRTALKDADGNFNKAIETFRGYSDTASWQAKADELAAKFSGAKVTIGQTATKPGNHGERLYKNISRELGGDQAASEYLHSLGIRGIKYLDGTSRGKGEGNYNYVIFNDEDVEIKAKYSLRRQQVQSDLPAETKGQKFWRIMQDRYNRLKKIESFLEEKGVQLSELAKVSRGLSVMNGKVADQLQRFMDGKIAPLVEEAAKHKVSLADIEEFLLMQHAAEANEQMRKLHKDEEATAFGVTDAEADQKLQDFRARADFAQLERIANKFRALSDDTANMLEKEGIISPEMKAAWDNAYQFYVPLRGGDEDTKQGTGKGLRVNGKQQRRSGHGRRDEHVIENIVKARERAVKAVEKNRVALSVAQLVREAADDSIGTVGKPEKRRVFRNKPMYTVLHKGEPIASFDSMDAADRFTAMDKRDGGNLSDYVVRISSDPTVSWATSPTLGENEINAYVNGYQVRIQINDEIAAQALTNGGVEQLATIFKAGKSINNYLSRVYTGYDPRFTIRNTARDFTAGMINLTGDYGAATAAKIALNYPIAVKELIKAGKDPSRSSWVDRYRQAGGSTGASWLPSIERLGENIENMYHEQIGAIATYQKVYGDEVANGASPMKAHVKASAKSGIAGFRKIPVLGHFLKLIEAMNGVSENAFRLATFKTLIDEGKSAAEAGEAAKNSTINFDTRGEWGNQIGALYLFFNPAIQGVRRTGKALFESEHKFQAQAMAGSMALVGFMAAELARSMWDDDEWDKIPRSVKNRNLVIRTGEKTQLTIPIPYEYGTFVGIGYAINDVAHGKADAKTGLNLAGTLMDAASVIGNPVTDKGEIQPLQMTPTLIKLLLAPTMNLNNFGREIQPDKNDTSAKPDSQNMYRDTKGSYYEKAAGKLNELTGGTKYSAGAVDISPEVLKFYTRSALGGSFTFLDQVLNLGIMTANGVKPDVGEMPLVNVVARENTVRDTRSAFYEIANASKKALEEYNAAKKDHAFEIAQSLKEKNAELIAVSKVASTQKKLAKAKRDAIDAIRLDEDLDLAEKRERMKQLERQEEIIYNRLIARFRE